MLSTERIAGLIVHVLNLRGREHHGAHNEKPLIQDNTLWEETSKSNFHDAGCVTYEAAGVDEIPHDEARVRTDAVIVPKPKYHQREALPDTSEQLLLREAQGGI